MFNQCINAAVSPAAVLSRKRDGAIVAYAPSEIHSYVRLVVVIKLLDWHRSPFLYVKQFVLLLCSEPVGEEAAPW